MCQASFSCKNLLVDFSYVQQRGGSLLASYLLQKSRGGGKSVAPLKKCQKFHKKVL